MSVAKREELDSSCTAGEAEKIVDDDVDGAADVVAMQGVPCSASRRGCPVRRRRRRRE